MKSEVDVVKVMIKEALFMREKVREGRERERGKRLNLERERDVCNNWGVGRKQDSKYFMRKPRF